MKIQAQARTGGRCLTVKKGDAETCPGIPAGSPDSLHGWLAKHTGQCWVWDIKNMTVTWREGAESDEGFGGTMMSFTLSWRVDNMFNSSCRWGCHIERVIRKDHEQECAESAAHRDNEWSYGSGGDHSQESQRKNMGSRGNESKWILFRKFPSHLSNIWKWKWCGLSDGLADKTLMLSKAGGLISIPQPCQGRRR